MNSSRESTPNLIEFWEYEVKPRLRVDEVYQKVRFSQREGRYWRGACPLHDGKNANFSVDTTTLRWTCFSRCGSGSVMAFLNNGIEPKGAKWIEKLRDLAERVGASLPQRTLSPAEMQQLQEKERRTALLEAFWQLAQKTLQGLEGESCRKYLVEERGFSEKELNPFGLCPSSATVSQELLSAGFTQDEITASGLLRDTRWEGRVLVAWRDHRGEIGTFAARDITGEAAPENKYLYLSVQDGWARKKSDLLLYGLDTALPALQRALPLIVVEGIFDALLLHARGMENVAAIGGGGQELSSARLEKLRALGASQITLLLDNDVQPDFSWPGLSGTVAIIKNVRNVDNVPVIDVVHPAVLGEFKDPDSFVRARGIEALQELLDERQPAQIFQARLILEGITPRSNEANRRAAVDAILELSISLIGERAVLDREDILQLTARFTGYSYEALGELSQEWERRRAHEALEKKVDATLREAQRRRSAHEPASQVLSDLNQEIAVLRAQTHQAPPAFSVERLERESTVVPTGKLSGWPALDNLDVRFNAGELAVIGARTGHGKTSILVSLLLNWLQQLAAAPGDEVIVLYSAEEPELRIYHRLLAILTANASIGWTVSQIRDFLRSSYSRGADYTWPDPALLKSAREFLQNVERRLLIIYRPDWSIEEVESHARALHKTRPISAVLVDYLQRIPPPSGRFDRRDQEVSAIGRRLKALSVDVAAPVITGAQINREAIPDGYAKNMNNASYESAKSTILKARPELHHLREGGSEQEADLVLGLLNYAADYRGDDKLGAATLLEIGTLKNRYGEAGKWARLAFEGRYGRVREPSYSEDL